MLKSSALRGIFDYDQGKADLDNIALKLQSEEVWQDKQQSQELQKQAAKLEKNIGRVDAIIAQYDELSVLWELAQEENDDGACSEVYHGLHRLGEQIDKIEFERMFAQPMDANNAFLEIQSGSGGTEAQDWAEMLVRMYGRWAEKKGFSSSVLDWSVGDVAGIKGATIKVQGEYAFGWLRTETGIHRLVRKSPFDSGNRRHTSFAAVYVTPEIDDTIAVDLRVQDCRIDTYRASGAGGQHVNTTDSAVRITHVPTDLVVQCQSERSQHQNKARAMQQLRAKLYEHERRQKLAEQQKHAQSKDAITWGSQIRSYVLDQSRIKDLRTGYEVGNTQAVLDGDLDGFIAASLKHEAGLKEEDKQ